MAESFNIPQLYAQAFGYVGKPFPTRPFNPNILPTGGIRAISDQFKIPAPYEAPAFSTEIQAAILGTPLFMPTRLDGWQMPNEPIIEISGVKTVIKTAVAGSERKGTVKELIAIDDYQIRIRGLAINMDNPDEYPEEQVRKLRELCEKRANLKIDNALSLLFGVYEITVENFNFPGMEGFPGVQPYEISAVSDEPFELELKADL